jgi:hypothetical protein
VGLRLLILSWWTPKYIIRKELENISDKTTRTLKALISKYAIKQVAPVEHKQLPSTTTIQEQRAVMAQTQSRLVETLASALGHDEAVKLSREALFSVGQNLGKQARDTLGVSDSQKDLARAAKILYRVLGIEFHLEWHDQYSATVIIDQCALARQYSKLACEVLSATDEGVINGLQPNLTMEFREYMTSGCKNCLAEIKFNGKETAH